MDFNKRVNNRSILHSRFLRQKRFGIYPLNRKCFSDYEFLPASVTDTALEKDSTSTETPPANAVSYVDDELSMINTPLYFPSLLIIPFSREF